MAGYGFHSEAVEEYLAATKYYVEHVSPWIAASFVAEVETAIETAESSLPKAFEALKPMIRHRTIFVVILKQVEQDMNPVTLEIFSDYV